MLFNFLTKLITFPKLSPTAFRESTYWSIATIKLQIQFFYEKTQIEIFTTMSNCLRHKEVEMVPLLLDTSDGRTALHCGGAVRVFQTPLHSSSHVSICHITWGRTPPFSFPWKSKLSYLLSGDHLQREAGASVKVVPRHWDQPSLLKQDGTTQPSWCSGLICDWGMSVAPYKWVWLSWETTWQTCLCFSSRDMSTK